MTLVDANILVDLASADPIWAPWSRGALNAAARDGPLVINDAVYAEVSVGFDTIEACETFLMPLRLRLMPMPRPALFLAGKVFRTYRRRGGTRTGVLPDFFIGAHAAVAGLSLLTRDPRRYRTYFPTLDLVAP